MPSNLCAPLRTLLLAVIAPLLLLAGCTPAEPVFKSTDITGTSYGKTLRLTDHNGQERTLADFKGKVVTIFFGYTQCPDVCPTALSGMSTVMQELGPDAERVQVLFVTVDPERDTPALLAEYMRAFHPSFLGLHADLETTAATAREFKVFYKKVPTGSSYTMDHTALSFVFDPNGRLRLAVNPDTPADTLAQDLRQLL